MDLKPTKCEDFLASISQTLTVYSRIFSKPPDLIMQPTKNFSALFRMAGEAKAKRISTLSSMMTTFLRLDLVKWAISEAFHLSPNLIIWAAKVHPRQ